jgi:preprotein translocase subunit SecE
MENTNSKIITASLAFAAVVLGVTIHLLIKAFAGAFGIIARVAEYDVVRHGLPILAGLTLFGVCQFHPTIRGWADEVVAEIRKVVFPSRKDTVAMTTAVIIMVLISSLIITVMDWASGLGLNALINLAK